METELEVFTARLERMAYSALLSEVPEEKAATMAGLITMRTKERPISRSCIEVTPEGRYRFPVALADESRMTLFRKLLNSTSIDFVIRAVLLMHHPKGGDHFSGVALRVEFSNRAASG